MNKLICPACGCSLVRLRVRPQPSLAVLHGGSEYFCCCAGCRELFLGDPERYLEEAALLEICPVCLAEKPVAHTVRIEHEGRVLHFCRCPHCAEEFRRRPEHYLALAEGALTT
jgi:YHS domain-containing protein